MVLLHVLTNIQAELSLVLVAAANQNRILQQRSIRTKVLEERLDS